MLKPCQVIAMGVPQKRFEMTNKEEYDAGKCLHQPDWMEGYEGSAPNIGSASALRILKRSVEKYGL